MEFEESIYNLIPKEAYVPPKEQRHKSKHNPKAAPSSSTFCLNTTSKPGLANVAGVNAPSGSNHVNIGGGNTFGLPKGAAKPNAGTFRLKGTGTIKIPERKYKFILSVGHKSTSIWSILKMNAYEYYYKCSYCTLMVSCQSQLQICF